MEVYIQPFKTRFAVPEWIVKESTKARRMINCFRFDKYELSDIYGRRQLTGSLLINLPNFILNINKTLSLIYKHYDFLSL